MSMTRNRLSVAHAVGLTVILSVVVAGVGAQHQRPALLPDRLASPSRYPGGVPAPGEVGVLPVQGNVYLLNLGAVNVVAQVGNDGILLVDTGPAEWSQRLLQTLRDRFGERPVRYVINTHMHSDHTGGNASLVKAMGRADVGGGGGGAGAGPSQGVRLIAHENALNRMQGVVEGEQPLPEDMLPSSTFSGKKRRSISTVSQSRSCFVGPRTPMATSSCSSAVRM